MERIHLPKDSMIRQIILSGLKSEGFTQIELTECTSKPIYLFYNDSIKKIALFKGAMSNNELLIIGYKLPGKLQIIIDEFNALNDNCYTEIIEILKQIVDGSYFEKNYEVTFL